MNELMKYASSSHIVADGECYNDLLILAFDCRLSKIANNFGKLLFPASLSADNTACLIRVLSTPGQDVARFPKD